MSAARFSASFPAPSAAPAIPAPNPLLGGGERLGVWRITATLHACDSGRWYRAEHSLAREQATAVLVYEDAGDGAPLLLRFAELSALLAPLQHPVLAAPLDSGLTRAGLPYLALPWQDGQPLLAACSELPLRQRLELLLPLCEGLQYAHEQGLLLRELDPGLLWLAPGQQPRLMALGLAELAPELDAPPPRFSLAALPFVAPELMRPKHPAQPSLASEAYALGVLACWLVNGRAPRPNANGVLMPSMASMASLGTAERFSLEALLQKAMAPSPALRHPSARELGEDLRAWLAGRNHSALTLTPMPEPSPAPRGRFAPVFDGSASTEPQPKKKRGKAWRGLFAAGGLALLALVGWAGREAYLGNLAVAGMPAKLLPVTVPAPVAEAASASLPSL